MKIAPHRAERPNSAPSGHRTASLGSHPTAAAKEEEHVGFRNSEDTPDTARCHVARRVHRDRGGVGRWSRSASLDCGLSPIRLVRTKS
jgi:hypothetical protein